MLEDTSTLMLGESLEGYVRGHQHLLGERLEGYVRGHQHISIRRETSGQC